MGKSSQNFTKLNGATSLSADIISMSSLTLTSVDLQSLLATIDSTGSASETSNCSTSSLGSLSSENGTGAK